MKLLNLTVRYYLIFSVFVLLIGIPLFYFVINKLIIYDIDKTLVSRKEKVLPRIGINKMVPVNPAEYDIDEDIILVPTDKKKFNDTIFNINIFDELEGELEPYRELSSFVVIHGKSYNLKLQTSLVEAEYLITSVVAVQGLLLFTLLSGLLLINRAISKRIWTPFYKTINELKSTELNHYNKLKLEDTFIEEFNDLNHAIEQLVEKNYAAFNNQKQFTENASHEIQTPIALIQSKIDLLIQTPNLSEEQAKIIDYISDSLIRLSKVNKSLLLLSKIENHQFIETDEINFEDLFQKVFSQYEDRIQTKQLLLKTRFFELPRLTANVTLIEVLLSNLIRNSIQHNYEMGIINIVVDKSKITIENSGKPLKNSPELLFERFQKDNQNPSNSGLGLSIVKKICETYNYKIGYRNFENMHIIELNFYQ